MRLTLFIFKTDNEKSYSLASHITLLVVRLATEQITTTTTNKLLCQYGCGELIDILDKQGRPRFYKNHHWATRYNKDKEPCLKIPCKCGCGTLIDNFDNRGRSRQFKIGHQSRNVGHYNWKGDNCGLGALHMWIRSRLPKPERCQMCNQIKQYLDLANISKTYDPLTYSRNLKNWMYLCRKCHVEYDGTARRRKGMPLSVETRIKLSLANRTKKLSDECKRKMTIAQRNRRKREKEIGLNQNQSLNPHLLLYCVTNNK